MDFAEVIRRRRMVRRFADRPLPSDVVDRILASATRAPSAGFSQGWAFLALTDEADRERFWPFAPNQTKHTPEMMNAPLVVVPLAHKAAYLDKYQRLQADEHWPAPYWFIDTGMATLLMLLTAVDEGLAACFFGIQPPEHPRFSAAFGVPEEYTAIGCVSVEIGRASCRERV